jgi:formylglycine-generating enzyme required for sulfatase activity/energy-coupling factor transporter ATP-binding protein EcfA2
LKSEVCISTEAVNTGSGGIAATGGVAAGAKGIALGGDVRGPVVIAHGHARVVVGDVPVPMTAVERQSALGRYLSHLISLNRYLQLQGIRSGGRLVHIELDHIYIRLRATRRQTVEESERWLREEGALAPGERQRLGQHGASRSFVETVTVKVEEALAANPRLVVLGDPGSGKTTLLRYLALLYARDLAEETSLVRDQLGLSESGRLPILLPLRKIGAFLSSRHSVDDGTEGHLRLLEFLFESLEQERIPLPRDFWDRWLLDGHAVILLDGLDEVADPDLRKRVSRLVESFVRAYEKCRYVVTCRIVGYTGPACLGEAFTTTTVRDFTMGDVELFLSNWHRMVAIGQLGNCETAESYAASQTRQLVQAIESNDRIRELAINPLMLTVIAMVHRDRVKLPDRRAELYAEAVDVLLGKWDEARGIREVPLPDGKVFDLGDKRVILQSLALFMHERNLKEISLGELRDMLRQTLWQDLGGSKEVERSVEKFIRTIEERTGLLAARGEATYGFSHLTFQEYLAAVAVAVRDDHVSFTLKHTAEPWWREVILLEVGYLSTQGKERATRLIQSIVDQDRYEDVYHNLVLAAECVRDVGANRVDGGLEAEIQRRLRKDLDVPPPQGRFQSLRAFLSRGMSAKALTERRIAAVKALAQIGGNRYWLPPWGEPEWVPVPAGEFWMGSDQGSSYEQPQHRVSLEAFRISRVPVTNAQFHLFTQDSGHQPPAGWEEGRPPRDMESHPVTGMSWHDAMEYCRWLSRVTGMDITLPSEAQWEKAARGDRDARPYPWGDAFDATRCNSSELGLNGTTPVGIFPSGVSPYECLDMAGDVWEWTRSLWGKDREKPEYCYPYDGEDGREKLDAPDKVHRVLRGGSFNDGSDVVRCSARNCYYPYLRHRILGFRVVASPISEL